MRNNRPFKLGSACSQLLPKRLKTRSGQRYVCLVLFALLVLAAQKADSQPTFPSTEDSTSVPPPTPVQAPDLQNLLAEPADLSAPSKISTPYDPALGPPPEWHTPSEDSLIVVETFNYPQKINQPPDNWEGRSGWHYSRTKRKDIYYTIQSESNNLYLSAETKGKAVNFGREVKVNLRLHNKLRFRWRVHSLPEGGNEEDSGKNDSAAAVRLLFGRGLGVRSLKYVWSATLPVGTETESPLNPRAKVIVKESGTDHLGKWVWIEVNAYEDYKRMFGGEPRPVDALSIITDSDNTKSLVKADYDDFMFFISPPETEEMIPDFMLNP